ncbi:MAG: tRNA uridine-5-carboxymethylaminomethyl(34) synthesis GTPase MnmE [Elusimicrobia bacterium]|nr:tRNA uridine-5-carboxymethylaminomethyl(34) synthesis GTPase MnmE [Elusimicrobiota bacterium]
MTRPLTDTIAAVATPAGSGALGIVRLSGPAALPIGQSLLRLKADKALAGRRAAWAEIFWMGELLDECVATYFPASASPTGEDLLELSCHGSPYILGRALQICLEAGARHAAPGEFTLRSFLNGRMDLAQAEAVCELIGARSRRAHRNALCHLKGGLSRRIAALREPILELLVRLEACLDHPEEDLPSLSPLELERKAAEAEKTLAELGKTFRQGRFLRQGARVCLAGRPNAGKSSLLNALLGIERAIVCQSPGTTRDTLEECLEIQGLPCLLIDTAGLGQNASDPAENIGMERAREALKSSDLVLLVVDGSSALDPKDLEVHDSILGMAREGGCQTLVVRSKSDLPSRVNGLSCDAAVSAKTGEGLGGLSRLVVERLAAPEEQGETLVVTSQRHIRSLDDAARELALAGHTPARHPGRWEDRAACHLRQALQALDEITGQGAPDEVLREVFSRFCIGK